MSNAPYPTLNSYAKKAKESTKRFNRFLAFLFLLGVAIVLIIGVSFIPVLF